MSIKWEHDSVRGYHKNHTPLLVIQFPIVSRILKAIRALDANPELADMPFEVGDNGNDVVVPRSALGALWHMIQRGEFPRFKIVGHIYPVH
ncbi:hypothetical protein COU16_01200 [Candidatus Kaiserbacteria bacterium CG10_big_fil_rev_8_21_14_0_10_47_16]|uniref:Uncharacterized protein n=1 Tax=Candidatus Kaiserbacteria bacterium CG10_big_fil_rev_8_21_14_0_10_47_16 TaxID=1974608 RepID=A0A2H0UGH6_9BACT|nr:MAG: hypothetical protein COU16_01200 [Candidatus Kaiserbacteria bacterium CG10_big_fil_rev_8_21_14_0_10_47_16]